MSTKTTFKRVALVTVAALGFGLLSSVTPASAETSTALNAAVGPNGATSLTVVDATDSAAAALIRLDVTVDSATPATSGLQAGESITASVIGVPTTVTAKTLAANGGSLADTATAASTGSGLSDFVMIEMKGQTAGVPAATAAASTRGSTNWETLSNRVGAQTNVDSFGAFSLVNSNIAATDGVLGGYPTGGKNTFFRNMDSRTETLGTNNTVSYYVSVAPRSGAVVVGQGAYTFQFQLTDVNGVVRGTKTVKIDFVSSAATADATLAVATSGTFLAGAALATSDSTSATYATVTLRNRDGGLVRTATGAAPTISSKMQVSTTDAPVFADTNTAGTTRLNLSDTGTLDIDFGTSSQGYRYRTSLAE